LVEATYMEMKHELEDEYIDLTPRASKIAPQSLPPLEPQRISREQGEVVPPHDDPKMDVYTLEFNETQ